MHLSSHVFDSQRRVLAGLCAFIALSHGAGPVWTQEPGCESGPAQENRAVPIVVPQEQTATDGYPSALDTRESSGSDRTRASGANESDDAASNDGAAALKAEVSTALVPLSGLLSSFDSAKRTNAVIELELGNGATADDEQAAARISALWNSGGHMEAVDALRTLETREIPLAVGVAWKRPMPMGTGIAASVSDTRIGGSYVGASQVVVDGDWFLGTIFVAVRWQALDAYPGWSLNISTDHGATFSETYYWYGYTDPVIDIDMTTVKFGEQLPTTYRETFVAYIYEGTPQVANVRLFRSTNGEYLDHYVWFDDTDRVKLDVAIDSYAELLCPYYCIYLATMNIAVIEDGGYLRYNAFGHNETAVTDAVGGLDFSIGWDSSSGAYYLYASYIDTDGQVRVWRGADGDVSSLGSHTGANWTTALTAAGQPNSRMICLFESETATGQQIKSYGSTDQGGTWRESMLPEPVPGAGDCALPAMPAHVQDSSSTEWTWGWGAVYAQAGNAYFTRYNWDSSQWTVPVRFNDYSCYQDGSLAIGFIPEAPGGELYSLGLVYLHRDWVPPGYPVNYPYFDRAPGPGGYCHAQGVIWEQQDSGYIRNVKVGAINKSSWSEGYGDFTHLSTEMGRGSGYELNVTSRHTTASYHCGVWVDWNHDLDFDDPGEFVHVTGSPGAGPYTATITPDSYAALGATRMRIRLAFDETPQPCGGEWAGEVEDYTIIVSGYCGASSGCGQYISRVQLGDVDKSSGCDGFNSYSTPVPDLYIGEPHPITVTVANGYAGNSGSLWIDWNQDMDFYDAGESIVLTGSPGPGPYRGTITPPASALTGQTRMRVRVHREVDEHDPCGNEAYGEVEDYAVMVRPAYCTAEGACGGFLEQYGYISRVQVGRIDSTSDCRAYNNFTALSTPASVGAEYPLTMTLPDADHSVSGGAWIDWNQDGDFEDAGEEVALSGSPGAGPYRASIVPPNGAPLGATRMRLRVRDARTMADVRPCGRSGLDEWGEVEDYTIVVVELACPGIVGEVGLEELADFVECLAGPGEPPAPPASQCVAVCLAAFDFDWDLDVDTADFAVFQSKFEGTQ